MTGNIGNEVKGYGSLSKVPAEDMGNVRNDMYLTSETIRLLDKNKVGNFDADTNGKLQLFRQQIDNATRFISAMGENRGGKIFGFYPETAWRITTRSRTTS